MKILPNFTTRTSYVNLINTYTVSSVITAMYSWQQHVSLSPRPRFTWCNWQCGILFFCSFPANFPNSTVSLSNSRSYREGRVSVLATTSNHMPMTCLLQIQDCITFSSKNICISFSPTKYTGFIMRLAYGCSKDENYHKIWSQTLSSLSMCSRLPKNHTFTEAVNQSIYGHVLVSFVVKIDMASLSCATKTCREKKQNMLHVPTL